jgi:hypothetical protein
MALAPGGCRCGPASAPYSLPPRSLGLVDRPSDVLSASYVPRDQTTSLSHSAASIPFLAAASYYMTEAREIGPIRL